MRAPSRGARRAVAQAEAAGEKEALANALSVLDWAQMDLGRLEYPTNSERALALIEDLGDLQGQGRMFNFLGLFAHQHGRWDEAVDLYGRAQDMARRVGNAVATGHVREQHGRARPAPGPRR